MKRIALLLSAGCLAGLPVHAVTAQQVGIQAEKLCTERPPSLFVFRAEAAGMTPPLRFDWDLGDGARWTGPEVPDRAYEFGRYNVVLSVVDADGRVRKASIALDVEAMGCGGI